MQCRDRWRYTLDSSIERVSGRTGTWTEDEFIKLKDAVQTHGGKSWAQIAALVPDRTKKQCKNRWYGNFNPSTDGATARTGKWAEDEDTKLKDAVLTHGDKDWKKVATLVLGRTKRQCWGRWRDTKPNCSTVMGR